MTKKLLLWLLCAALLCAAAVGEAPSASEAPSQTEAPEALITSGALTARAYVAVYTATQAGLLPLPEEGEQSFPLVQILPDGTQAVNVIHLTPEGVYMEDSTCENHDCVDQGIVTLENRDERILSNMIICLPNQVWLQLLTADEAQAMLDAAGGEATGP